MAEISCSYTDKMSKLMDQISQMEVEFKAKLDEAVSIEEPDCTSCVKKYSDIAVSKVIKSALGGFTYANAQVSVIKFFKGMKKRGIKISPQSKRSWESLCREKGWPIEPI